MSEGPLYLLATALLYNWGWYQGRNSTPPSAPPGSVPLPWVLFRMSEIPLQRAVWAGQSIRIEGSERMLRSGCSLQGYLAHKKQPPPLGPP